MSKPESARCYMCTEPSTGREHVPARCFFPDEAADHLITVPSCDRHNRGKQLDDEYLRAILVMNMLTNESGLKHGMGKVKRAHRRKPAMLGGLLSTARPVLLRDVGTGDVQHSAAIVADTKRVNSVLEHYGRAIFFHHFGCAAPERVEVFPAFLMNENRDAERQGAALRDMAATLFSSVPLNGANPTVFEYRVRDDESAVAVELRFYGNNVAVVAFRRAHASSQ